MKLWSFILLVYVGLSAGSLSAADLSTEQVEQQIKLSHMLGQISQEEQAYRVGKVRSLGVDGYYEWLRNDDRTSGKTASNGGAK